MLDHNYIRHNLEEVEAKLLTKGYHLDVHKFSQLDSARKHTQTQLQKLQHLRNSLSRDIGKIKSQGGNPDSLQAEVTSISEKLAALQLQAKEYQQEFEDFLLEMPNIPHISVPVGIDESANQQIRTWGDIPKFSFPPLEHHELACVANHNLDFAGGAKISGSRFVVLRNDIARLHRALAQFMLDFHVNQHGYTEVYPPYLVKSSALYGTGQLPKFIDDQFGTNSDNDLWLIPTAEVPLTNLVRESILDEQKLPLCFVAHTPCFRKEAGSYGRDTKGLIRQHQFDKVELVRIEKPQESYKSLELMLTHAEVVLQKLGLPYRVMLLCSGDMACSASKTYDLEVWLPGQNAYREISSCSITEDFQARRMQARYKSSSNKNEFVHTLNGSGVAVGRALVAVLENYQTEDGNYIIPKVLQPYMER